jgi:aminomuconate-semialdehyde/2-hydroxymuconate-6-semialdehyde dehydrogenase
MQRLANFIAGKLVAPLGGNYLDNLDPATGQVYSHLPDSDERDVQQAVEAARAAFGAWSSLPAEQRSRHLLRLADLIERDLEKLARAESIDTGKPIALARSVDIPRAVANFRFFATAVLHTRSDLHETDGRAINYTLRRPRGVAGCISPWNLPLYLFTWKIAPALATGNTVVGKPSEVTPMTAFMLAELCLEAGLPPGALNIVHGLGAKVGAAIVSHPDVPTLSFTGGTKTGRWIAQTAGPMFKRMSLELGGKNPTIVFADADLDEALDTSVKAAFSNQGQICLCGSRIFVERPAYEKFVARFVERAASLKIGDPLDPATEQGAIVSQQHLEKIQSYLDMARRDGGTIHGGGNPRMDQLAPRCRGGSFLLPAVITDLPPACRVMKEEIFGPVVTITPFGSEDEAIALANDVEYGLAATIWTRDLARAHRTAAAVQAGVVWINCWLLRDLRTPFGGMKASGVGREGGEEALHFFTEPKNICLATPS